MKYSLAVLIVAAVLLSACSTAPVPVEVLQGRFETLEGFEVERVASSQLVGSVVNMTFDPAGRPALAIERAGVFLLVDGDGDGVFEKTLEYANQIHTAHGMHYLGPGDLLVHAEGPDGPGLYRLLDRDRDDRAEEVQLIALSDGDIQEHGPHQILEGADGHLYVLFGNHAYPEVRVSPDSPSRGLREDQLLPRYLDPRGHANRIRAPAGTIHRLSPDLSEWRQLAAGFRNPFDIAFDASGELFTFEADMEWDLGLPWFKPVRILHVIPGADYGWRTGSGKFPSYYLDTLPSVDEVGRGSPTGIAFYDHDVYPERFDGALFMGDWSRGRIRVLFPRAEGASFQGDTHDFLIGEPLNVTDLDVGPDGSLYFATGGRLTTGGVFRVRYTGPTREPVEKSRLHEILDQPMARSAWGRESLRKARAEEGDAWGPQMRRVLEDSDEIGQRRLRALEYLQVLGPPPDRELLVRLARDPDPLLRAGAVFLLGTHPFAEVEEPLDEALRDSDPVVARRACEAVVRSGWDGTKHPRLVDSLFELLGRPDRFLRTAARIALTRTAPDLWLDRVTAERVENAPRSALEALLALVHAQRSLAHRNLLYRRLTSFRLQELDNETLLSYLRVLQLTLIRSPRVSLSTPYGKALSAELGPFLLRRFPSGDHRLDRELQAVMAYLQTPGAIEAILTHLAPDQPQEEQIHSIYCLRAINRDWTRSQRDRLIDWFERAWRFRGAASMQGYMDALWDSALRLLPAEERQLAEARREAMLEERTQQLAWLAAADDDSTPSDSVLRNMSFPELSDYLELDPMSYARATLEEGRRVFYRAKCVDCHVFGSEGRGGGPDLSTVVKRFRRREILESIMYPSLVVSDQYTALQVETRDGESLLGMLAAEDSTTLTLIDATGRRLEIAKSSILSRRRSTESLMPEGLLESMSLRELTSLFLFLEQEPEF